MYELRTLTGTVRSADGTVRAGANVRIVRETAVADGDAFPPSAVAFYTDAAGAVPVGTAVAVPSAGSWAFSLWIDNVLICSLALGAGAAITVAELMALAGLEAGDGTPQNEMLLRLYTAVAGADDGQMLAVDGGLLEIVDPPSGVSDVGDLTTAGLTAANMLRVAGDGGLEQRTPEQVRGDVGAEASGSAAAAVSGHLSAIDHTKIPTADEAAWLTAARAAVGSGGNVIPDATTDGLWARLRASGVGSWLAAGGAWLASFWGAANEAAARLALGLGTAAVRDAETSGVANTVTLRNADGAISNSIALPFTEAIRGVNTTGNGIYGQSSSGAGMYSRSISGDHHHKFHNESAIARTTGALVFLGAFAATNRAAQRTELGLGTIATQDADAVTITGGTISGITELAIADGGTGASKVDGARANLGFAPVAMPARVVDHSMFTWAATDVVGAGLGQNIVNSSLDVRSGATANGRCRYRPNYDQLALNRCVAAFANWSRKIEFTLYIRAIIPVTTGVFRAIWGKPTTEAFGLTGGNYIGVGIENQTLTSVFVCRAGALESQAVSVAYSPTVGISIYIVSENGSVKFFINDVLIAQTTNGPIATAALGTLNLEIENFATASNYIIQLWSQSRGY